MTSVDIVPTPEADPSRSIRSDRMVEIDVAKGIAISLVAWGHLVGRGIHPSGETWIYVFYGWKEHLYSFHLSVFFFLGGIVFFACPVGKRLARFRNTAVKMISAYVLFLFGVYFSARILSGFVRVSLPIGNPWDDLGYALLYPTESFVSYLWFIPCFLALMAIGTLTSGLSSSMRRFIIFASFLFLPLSAFEQVSKLFEFNQIARYLFFFLLGEYYLLYRARLLETLRSTWVLWFSAFIVSLMVFDLSGRQVVSALLSLPALVGLSVFLKN
jgi:fucose 4-O-acetylase-like acetyltransferase